MLARRVGGVQQDSALQPSSSVPEVMTVARHMQVMLDTEGIDAWDQTGQYSVQIFSLAVLLSSLFVYNQMGGIDEAALDRLSLVTEMTKHIRARSGGGAPRTLCMMQCPAHHPAWLRMPTAPPASRSLLQANHTACNATRSTGSGLEEKFTVTMTAGPNTTRELAQFTPSFLWLLRDFYLSLEEDGRKISPREYLETALSNVEGTTAGARAKNGIRDSIKSLFPDRDCFTLVRPMSDEAKLAHLESVPPEQLRPEFREGLSQLVETCFVRAQPKRIQDTILTGPMLAGLVTAYVDAINKGAVPTIATAWQGVAESECRRAADEAERTYREAFNADVPADPASMQAEHARAMGEAKRLYDRVRALRSYFAFQPISGCCCDFLCMHDEQPAWTCAGLLLGK